jgi:NADH-quinone oxidoreductase subunit M
MAPEYDLILMTLVIFVPTLFAVAILFIPRGQDELVRWIALFGTTITLVLSLWLLIDFQRGVVDANLTNEDKEASLLSRRVWNDKIVREEGKAPRGDDMVARYPWIKRFNIEYYLGVDGISMPLIVLTTLLSFLGMIASWKIERFTRGYCALFLLLETGMVGTFMALDFVLFYIFWEIMLLPMYFLIGVWGGPRREYAAIKFFLYTLLGSVFILIAMLAFYFTDVRDFVPAQVLEGRINDIRRDQRQKSETLTEEETQKRAVINSFDLMVLARAGEAAAKQINTGDNLAGADKEKKERLGQLFFQPWFQIVMFLLLFIGFAIKVPMFPFHTWLPDAHVEAPTPISMILAGILLKMGGYGMLRIAYPICPWAAQYLATGVCVFAMINIVYGAFAAMAQTDFKKLVAYSSISHMGYVVLGIAVWSAGGQDYWSWGMNGAMFQMIGHGITSAGMFFLVGVIYDRAHHRNLDNFRGLYEPMPLYGGISAIIFFAAMGLPGLVGFVGEFMVVLAAWNFEPGGKVFAVLAALTVVITASYILWTLQRVFMGQNPAYKDYPDINLRELLVIVPLVVLSIVLGVMPDLLMDWMEPSVTGLVNTLSKLGELRVPSGWY